MRWGWMDMAARDRQRLHVCDRFQPRYSFRPPGTREVAAFLAEQAVAGAFSYVERGATRDDGSPPAGYNLDHNRVPLGHGENAFTAACAALRAWRMFPGPWTRIEPLAAPIREGQTVVMLAHAMGGWWLNACRIVYVIDESRCVGAVARRFGFAYGTLAAHVEQGEERFSVELRADGSVWYDLRAFSLPRFWLVRLAKPLARRLQWRFVRESQAAMLAAVGREKDGLR